MKREALEGIKARRLARRLGLDRRSLAGTLTLLWDVEGPRNWPRGDIGKHTNEDIAVALEWPGDADELVAALVAAGILDEHAEARLVVHGWAEHAPRWLKGVVAKQWGGFIVPANAETSSEPGNQPSNQPKTTLSTELPEPQAPRLPQTHPPIAEPSSQLGSEPSSELGGEHSRLKTQDSRPKTQETSSSSSVQGDTANRYLRRLRDDHPTRPDPFRNKQARAFLWRLACLSADPAVDLIDDDDVVDFLDLMKGQQVDKPPAYLRTLAKEHIESAGGNLNALLRTIDVPAHILDPQTRPRKNDEK